MVFVWATSWVTQALASPWMDLAWGAYFTGCVVYAGKRLLAARLLLSRAMDHHRRACAAIADYDDRLSWMSSNRAAPMIAAYPTHFAVMQRRDGNVWTCEHRHMTAMEAMDCLDDLRKADA